MKSLLRLSVFGKVPKAVWWISVHLDLFT